MAMTNNDRRLAPVLAAFLFIAAQTAVFAAVVGPVELTVASPSAAVVTPQAALASYPDLLARFSTVDAFVSLPVMGGTLLIPKTLEARAHAVMVSAQAGEAPKVIAVTKAMAAELQTAFAKGDVASAAQTLNARFDSSKAGAVVSAEPAAPVAGRESAGPAPLSKPAAKPAWDKAKPLPAPVEIASRLANIDAAVEVHVSHSYPGVPGVDPSVKVAEFIDGYAADKSQPNAQKHLVVKYYEIGDPASGHSPVTQAIARAAKTGMKITVITDLATAMDGVFPKDEPHSFDFEHGAFKANSGPGRAMQYLTKELGFTFKAADRLGIVSGVPLWNPREKGEKPLMHDKGVYGKGADGKAYGLAWNGTANMNATEDKADDPAGPAYGGRYNRVLMHKDPAGNAVDWEHVEGEIAGYDKREGSKGLADELNVPKRVTYASGEFREIAFTNGKQNPNDRITAMLDRAAKSLQDALANKTQPDFELTEIVFSHFVLTNSPEVDSLRKYLDALRAFYPKDYQTRVKIFGVFDQQFISPDGFGEAAALDGMLVQRPMGKSIFPFRSEYTGMMKLYGYLRLLGGVTSVDPDAAPTKVHLWHDKTTIIKTKEAGKEWTYAWTRSLNNSGHFQSMESQDMYRLLPGSKTAQDMEDSIKKVAEAEPMYAIDLDKAIVAMALSHLTHHTPYDNGIQDLAARLISPAVHDNPAAVKAVLDEVLALPTKHAKAVDGAAVKEKVGTFLGFLQYYHDLKAKDPSVNELTYRKAINVAISIVENRPWAMRTSLDLLFWKPGQTPEQQERLMKDAWANGLKRTDPFPTPGARDAGQDAGASA